MEAPVRHEPVMLREVLAGLDVRPGGRYVDCTLDGGGHAEAIMDAASPGGALLGIDEDVDVMSLARERLARFGDAIAYVQGNFRDVDRLCRERGFAPVNGVLFDLGLSSHQLASETRGFSFRVESPLDMRFGPGRRHDGVRLGERCRRSRTRRLDLALRRRAAKPSNRPRHCPEPSLADDH